MFTYTDNKNKDEVYHDALYNREHYLDLASEWEDSFNDPVLQAYSTDNGKVKVVRDDLINYGSKARFGDLFVKECRSDTLVYVQPRVGYAGISLAYLCKKYNKRLILFCPASRELSQYQAKAHYEGAELRFFRVAAMQNLNRLAKAWAEKNGHTFIPLGLKHPLVTAGVVKVAYNMALKHGEPDECWSVISTGVLQRGLQIAWPHCQFKALAVARNIQDGELGRAEFMTSVQNFTTPTKVKPPYPSVETDDAKIWEFAKAGARDGAWIWNVAGEIHKVKLPQIVSYRDWKPESLFETEQEA